MTLRTNSEHLANVLRSIHHLVITLNTYNLLYAYTYTHHPFDILIPTHITIPV